MEQIIIGCTYSSEMFYRLRKDIDYLKDTNIDFKVNLREKEIILPYLNKSIMYVPLESIKNINNYENIIKSNNYLIKEILERDDKNVKDNIK